MRQGSPGITHLSHWTLPGNPRNTAESRAVNTILMQTPGSTAPRGIHTRWTLQEGSGCMQSLALDGDGNPHISATMI